MCSSLAKGTIINKVSSQAVNGQLGEDNSPASPDDGSSPKTALRRPLTPSGFRSCSLSSCPHAERRVGRLNWGKMAPSEAMACDVGTLCFR